MDKYIITITREFGSLGRPIAHALSQKLGIKYYDRDIVDEVAKQLNLPVSQISDAEESSHNHFFAHMFPLGTDKQYIQDMIFDVQKDIILDLARKSSCIIVGRCADYVLRDRKDCVNVFIHSDLARRIKRATEQYGLSPVKAGDEINKIDKQRATYYRYYSEKKWGRAENYDLSVYSDSIGLEACTDLILSFVDMKLSHRD